MPGKSNSSGVSFEPLHDFVIIRPINARETAGGIALPDDAEVENPRGEVVAMGPGRYSELTDWRPPSVVSVGDQVLLNFQSLTPPYEFEENGVSYIVVRFRDLMGVQEAE